jgi:hypothetical protein
MAATADATREQILERLRTDWAYWASNCAQILNTAGQLVPLTPKPAQLRVWEAAQRQIDAGKPVRLIVPKARKEGVSTFAVSRLVQQTTMTPNQTCITVAQDGTTAGELLQMATMIHANLPDSKEWPIKPPIANKSRRKELAFGNPSRVAQATGDFGINSRLIADTAGEFEAGRGFTFHGVHCSEAALWPNLQRKLTSLLNAVPDEPNTFVILESTANGFNHWRNLCMQAREGENDFELVFLAWFEEPQYVRPFLSDEERGEFIESIGTGPWGDDEPELVELGVTPEQLNWRRWAIANRTQGDLDTFHVEYPSHLDESFLSSGSTVFSMSLVGQVLKAAEQTPPKETGAFRAGNQKEYRGAYGAVQIPQNPIWEPGGGPWRVWKEPEPDARYILGGDPAGDSSFDQHERAMHAAVIIDHRTREQVAEMEMQGDSDEYALQVLLAALHYNRAVIAVETTGSWGAPVLRRIRRDWKYLHVYKRKRLLDGKETHEEVLGFDTNRTTKGFLIEAGREMLREGTHGIRSRWIAGQMTTYVRDVKSRFGPSPGERADLLMAFLIAHVVAHETPVRAGKDGSGSGVVNTTTRSPYAVSRRWAA